MAEETWGDHGYYFADSGAVVNIGYEVKILGGGEGPAEDADTSQAHVFLQTVVPQEGSAAQQVVELQKNGCHELPFDISSYAAEQDSPIYVQFLFEKTDDQGNTTTNDKGKVGILLAEPEAAAIHATKVGDFEPQTQGMNEVTAKAGETVSLALLELGVWVFQDPDQQPFFEAGIDATTSTPESTRFPQAKLAEIKWFVDGAEQGSGETLEYTVPDDAEGKALVVEAYRAPSYTPPNGFAKVTIKVPKLELVGADPKGGSDTEPSPHTTMDDEAPVAYRCRVTPAVEGSFQWTAPAGNERVAMGDGQTNSDPFDGEVVQVIGLKPSDADEDVTLKCVFTDTYGRKLEAEHKLTVKPWPVNLKGKVIYERDWDYLDSNATIAKIEEGLPKAKAALYLDTPANAGNWTKHADGVLGEDGEFEFKKVPEFTKAAVRVSLEHDGGKVAKIIGRVNTANDPDLSIQKDAVVWVQVELDQAKVDGKTVDIDFEAVKVTKDLAVKGCDLYKSVVFGHTKCKEKTGEDLVQVKVYWTQDSSSTSWLSGDDLYILEDDSFDRCVILHEYGHYIDHRCGPNPPHPGYEYNDDVSGNHGRTSKEHYGAAWMEGWATFLSCALRDEAKYHDGYDTYMTYDLANDNTTKGPHSEGSIQEALWAMYKTHSVPIADMFKAFKDTTHHRVDSAYAYYLNWKDLGLAKKDKLVAAYKAFGMEYHYTYTEAWKCVAKKPDGTSAFDATKNEFCTVDELYDQLGKTGGGTLADYKEELYNYNKYISKKAMDAGSSKTDPKVKVGTTYNAPKRVQVT